MGNEDQKDDKPGGEVRAEGDGSIGAGRDIYGSNISIGDKNYYLSGELSAVPGVAPKPPTTFEGRNDDLTEIKKLVSALVENKHATNTLAITAVKGLPGVGKTSFASALAHDPAMKQLFSDGTLWASLGPEPDVLGKLNEWGRAMKIDLSQSKNADEAAAALCGVLRDKKYLLIVDDVWEETSVEPFKVGGTRCAIIATTRLPSVARAVSPENEGIYALGTLSEDEAFKLFAKLAPGVAESHPEESRELVKAIDGLPLAIKVAAGLLNAEMERGFDFTALIEELKEGKKILDAQAPSDLADKELTVPYVSTLLNRSLERLSDEIQRRFALTCVLNPKPISFEIGALAYLWEVDDAKPTIIKLTDQGLLEPAGFGRFQIHSLLVTHGKNMLIGEDLYEAQFQHSKYYMNVLGLAGNLFEKGNENIFKALHIVNTEWKNAMVGYRWALERYENDDKASKLCIGYSNSCPKILSLKLHIQSLMVFLETAASAARKVGSNKEQCMALGNLGIGYRKINQFSKAIEVLEEALYLAEKSDYQDSMIIILGNMGSVYRLKGEHNEAIHYYEKSLNLARETQDLKGEASALSNLGSVYSGLGDTKEAIRFYDLAIAILDRIGEFADKGIVMSNVGLALGIQGEFSKSINYYEQALNIFRELGDRENEGRTLGNLALAYVDINKPIKAIEYIEQARILSLEVGDYKGEIDTVLYKSLALEKMGETEEAVELAQEALSKYKEIENPGVEKARMLLERLRNQSEDSEKE